MKLFFLQRCYQKQIPLGKHRDIVTVNKSPPASGVTLVIVPCAKLPLLVYSAPTVNGAVVVFVTI